MEKQEVTREKESDANHKQSQILMTNTKDRMTKWVVKDKFP